MGLHLQEIRTNWRHPVNILGVNMFWKGNLIDLGLLSGERIMNFRYMWSAETQRE